MAGEPLSRIMMMGFVLVGDAGLDFEHRWTYLAFSIFRVSHSPRDRHTAAGVLRERIRTATVSTRDAHRLRIR